MSFSENYILLAAQIALGVGSVIIVPTYVWIRQRQMKSLLEAVNEATHQAFIEMPEAEAKIREIAQSIDGSEECVEKIAAFLSERMEAGSAGRLFNLYSKQIERYQEETRLRATMSFFFAIVAMFAGFSFVIWGGTILLKADQAIVLAAGGLISTVGGSISGFITKTFLDVHKLSLTQLNLYFQQPVINDHVLMAQRLADASDDIETRKKAYSQIIESITRQIDSKGKTSQQSI